MSFLTISQCHGDIDLANRITACVASEGDNVFAIDANLFWQVAAADDVEAAYSAALANNVERPGADPSVVTDQMILSHVQAFTPAA